MIIVYVSKRNRIRRYGSPILYFQRRDFYNYGCKLEKKKEKINPEIWFYLVGSYIMSIIFLILVAFASSAS